MSLRIYRIISLIFSLLQIPVHAFLLYLNLTNQETDSLIVLASTLICLLLSIIETFVSIKTIKNNNSALYNLAFERDGKINKFAFYVSLVLGVIGLALLIFGIYYLIILNYLLGVCFTSIGIFILFNIIIYLSYIIVVIKTRYIR